MATSTVVIAAMLLAMTGRARAQHLWWSTTGATAATCVYGEITVLATHPAVYYCGANWHPGQPAGGYCGIQDNSPTERCTIFSIWDTNAQLHPRVTRADTKTIVNRFGGEGEGAHTHMLWEWKVGDIFRFVVSKRPGATAGTTDAAYYAFDPASRRWLHSATITSPNGDARSEASVATIGGGALASFLENFAGQDRGVPKLALYRLWLGADLDHMKCLTQARGDGTWGTLGDCYFLAEGDGGALAELFAKLEPRYGKPNIAGQGATPAPISDRPIQRDVAKQVGALMRKSVVPPEAAGDRR